MPFSAKEPNHNTPNDRSERNRRLADCVLIELLESDVTHIWLETSESGDRTRWVIETRDGARQTLGNKS